VHYKSVNGKHYLISRYISDTSIWNY